AADTAAAAGYRTVIGLQREIERIRGTLFSGRLQWSHPESRLEAGEAETWVVRTVVAGGEDARLREELVERETALRLALARLRRISPVLADRASPGGASPEGLWRTFDPAWSGKTAIVEYRLSSGALHLRLTTDQGSVVRRVTVSREEVLRQAEAVTLALGDPGKGGGEAATMTESLTWLYDSLLRPIEGDLGGRDLLLIVPDPSLSMLPMAALIRSRVPTPEYAVQRYRFGYLPSFHFAATMMPAPSATGSVELRLAVPSGGNGGAGERIGDSYRALLERGMGPVDALAEAQRNSLTAPEEGLRHPRAWAGVVVLGGP
ncbi:MAG: CHAT domain-containing protein, partial [Magnetococcales bacterium]|nr:CHAT domain-containing protein [Magnetococcales bacterium]